MKLLLVCNPSAGRGRGLRRAKKAEQYLEAAGADVRLEVSASPVELTTIAAEGSRDGYDAVVVCGGDGTIHHALRNFDLTRGTMAVVPSGSADDLAHILSIPQDVSRACQIILQAKRQQIDVATANGIRFLGVSGLGFDSEVTRYAAEEVKLLRGPLVYLYAILRVLPRFRPRQVFINGSEHRVMFVCAGNSGRYGGGIRITPDASLTDGALDLCIVRESSRLELIKTLPRAYRGSHVTSPFVELQREPRFEIDSPESLAVYADGERATTTPVTFAIASERLSIISG